MRVLAPAKVNLYLRVGTPRADGFHPLVSWMVTVSLFDTLIVDRSHGGEVRLECDDPGLPRDGGNLVSKAAAALARSLTKAEEGSAAGEFGLAVRLHKKIPVGAGLAGGSSDGARMLAALNVLWQAGWDRERLSDFAATLGSDLSFFFYEPSAICRGRGEIVRPIARPVPCFAVLILPGTMMPTPAVYRKFDEMKLGGSATIKSEPDFNGWTQLDALALLPLLENDLEAPAFAIDPALGELRRRAEDCIARPVRMSGSGSSLFTLFDGRAEAEDGASRISRELHVSAIAVELTPKLNDDLNRSSWVR